MVDLVDKGRPKKKSDSDFGVQVWQDKYYNSSNIFWSLGLILQQCVHKKKLVQSNIMVLIGIQKIILVTVD